MAAVTLMATVGTVSMIALVFASRFYRMARVVVWSLFGSGMFGLGGVVRMIHKVPDYSWE
jgi:hypothetical protein